MPQLLGSFEVRATTDESLSRVCTVGIERNFDLRPRGEAYGPGGLLCLVPFARCTLVQRGCRWRGS